PPTLRPFAIAPSDITRAGGRRHPPRRARCSRRRIRGAGGPSAPDRRASIAADRGRPVLAPPEREPHRGEATGQGVAAAGGAEPRLQYGRRSSPPAHNLAVVSSQ